MEIYTEPINRAILSWRLMVGLGARKFGCTYKPPKGYTHVYHAQAHSHTLYTRDHAHTKHMHTLINTYTHTDIDMHAPGTHTLLQHEYTPSTGTHMHTHTCNHAYTPTHTHTFYTNIHIHTHSHAILFPYHRDVHRVQLSTRQTEEKSQQQSLHFQVRPGILLACADGLSVGNCAGLPPYICPPVSVAFAESLVIHHQVLCDTDSKHPAWQDRILKVFQAWGTGLIFLLLPEKTCCPGGCGVVWTPPAVSCSITSSMHTHSWENTCLPLFLDAFPGKHLDAPNTSPPCST